MSVGRGDASKVSSACAGFAQFVKFGMERRPRLLSDVLQFAEQVLVGFSAAVDKQAFGIAVLPTLSDGIGEPLTDFDRAQHSNTVPPICSCRASLGLIRCAITNRAGRRPWKKLFRTVRFPLLALLFPSVKAGVYGRTEAC
jgi:hypothetical protein